MFGLYIVIRHISLLSYFFLNDTATTEIYTLSLHDALPISLPIPIPTSFTSAPAKPASAETFLLATASTNPPTAARRGDRNSTRLNSSHSQISYAVFCLKKKNTYE